MIGDQVKVTVVEIRGDKVRLGIDAPRQVGVHRQEVYEAINRQLQEAAEVDSKAAGSETGLRNNKDAADGSAPAKEGDF